MNERSRTRNVTLFVMSFNQLDGMNVFDAEQGLKHLLPTFNIIKIPFGSAVTLDFKIDRIRIYYNPNLLP